MHHSSGSSGRTAMATQRKITKPIIGWREWVSLPDLGITRIKTKVDTGARSSCLHAFDIDKISKGGRPVLRFSVHPMQREATVTIRCEAELCDQRWIRSSNGKRERRPVIRTGLYFNGEVWLIDLTLTSRDVMGFRMLLGREAVRRRFLVDPGRSYLIRQLAPARAV
jgi:hypothetical protein